MKLTAGSTAPPELPPAGTYVGRCFRVVDLGTHASTFNGQTRDRRLLLTTFELLDEDVHMSDGRPYALGRRFTLSLHEKSALRQMLQTWRGKPYADGEEVDLRKIAGQYGLVAVTLDASADGKVFANLASVVALPKAMPKPQGVNPAQTYFIDEDPDDMLLTLPEKLQTLIVESPEYKAKHGKPLEQRQPATVGDLADDIPW